MPGARPTPSPPEAAYTAPPPRTTSPRPATLPRTTWPPRTPPSPGSALPLPGRPALRVINGGASNTGRAGPRRGALRVAARADDGQAAVEFVAVLPIVLVVIVLGGQALLAGQAVWQARVAARAAARANAFGGDAAAAARDHLPSKLEHGLQVRAGTGGDVRVSIRVPTRAPRGPARPRVRDVPLPPAGMRFPHPSDERGQSSIEVLSFMPLVVLIGLVAFTVIAARTANEQAGEAAEAAALAFLQGGEDPRHAAVAALPDVVRRRATITITGQHVHVRVLARLPISGIANKLAGEADAIAGAGQ